MRARVTPDSVARAVERLREADAAPLVTDAFPDGYDPDETPEAREAARDDG